MKRSSRGFTMIELIVTLVIVGFLVIGGGARFFNLSAFREFGLVEETVSAIRYAQKVAMATRCEVRVQVNSDGVVYALRQRDGVACDGGTYNRSVPRPGSQTGEYQRTDSDGVALGGALELIYDSMGRPVDSAGQPLATSSVVVAGRTIRVEAETGLVHVQ